LRGKKWINDFVFGAVAAVVGPIIVTVLKMGYEVPFNLFLMTMAVVVFALTLMNKVPLWLLIPMGGVLNLIVIKLL
jgi:hypothetical protein